MKKKQFSALIITAMRLTIVQFFLATLFIINSYAHSADAQGILEKKISVNAQNTEVKKILEQVEMQTHVKFIFGSKAIQAKRKISVHLQNVQLGIFLSSVINPLDIGYKLVDGQILLYPEKQLASILLKKELPVPDPLKSFLAVEGLVRDEKGSSLPGVSITEKGTSNVVVTDEKGKFTITVKDDKAILEFSSIGFTTQEIPVRGNASLDITLLSKTSSMNEVIVVGYGAQSKRNVTGAIAKVDMKQMENLPNTNVSQALRGRVAGVQFIDNGRPGQGGSILIRGTRSLNGGNNPLIIVDGIQFNSGIADINPNDIESMEILKDASAAAIYGSRAANGVILITSKKGKSEKPSIRANVFYGRSDWSYKMKLLSPQRYLEALLDWRKQSGLASDPALVDTYLQASEAANYKAGKTIDPWDEIAQDGSIGSYDLSLSGRSTSTNYFLSGNLVRDKGLIFNDNQDRISLRANIENKINNWLTIGLNSTFIKRDLSGREADVANAYATSPYGTLYYNDGEPTRFPVPEEQVVANPMRLALLTQNEEIYNNLFTNLYTLVNIPQVKGLTYRFNYSPNFRWRHTYNFVRQDKNLAFNTTSASKFNQENFDWVLENIVTYKRRINDDHSFDVTLLYGQNKMEMENTTANASPLSNASLGWNSLGLGAIQTVGSYAEQTDGISSMFRLNYQLKSKYLFTFTIRRDGSSVFAENNKYANFPSAAVAWIVSDEKFLRNVKFINNLKLRGSYGTVGNQAISPYQSLSRDSTNQYVFGDAGTTSTGVFPISIANPDLKWETTTTSNAALDFGLFAGRLSGTVEAYIMNTKDLIVRRSLPVMTGYTSILTNLGATNNRGLEITLNTVNIQTKKFEWSTNLVFSTNKNKIVHLYNSDTNGDGKEDDDLANRWFIGKPVFVSYDYVQDGIYQEGETLPTGYKPGFVRLKDLNDDKTITAADRQVVGQLEPKYRWGFTNNLRYGNFNLSVFVNAMSGWNRNFNQLDFTGSSLGNNYPGRAVNMLDAGWWTADNKSATRPSLVYSNPFLHSYYVSRDFIRLQDVSLSYELPKAILGKAGLQAVRIYVSGKNLYTRTDWIGPDPESGYNSQAEYFPVPRSLVLGANLTF